MISAIIYFNVSEKEVSFETETVPGSSKLFFQSKGRCDTILSIGVKFPVYPGLCAGESTITGRPEPVKPPKRET